MKNYCCPITISECEKLGLIPFAGVSSFGLFWFRQKLNFHETPSVGQMRIVFS